MEKDVHPMVHLNRHEGLAWSLQMYRSEAAPVSAFMNFNALSAAGESAIHRINTRAIPVTMKDGLKYTETRGRHSNRFCTPIFVLGQDESQGTTTELSGGQ